MAFVTGFAAWMLWRESAATRAEHARYAALLARARLSPDQAVAIARDADGRERRPATAASLREIDGCLVWTVHDLIIGAGTSVEVDDATGTVLAVRQHPGHRR